jgi:hypothetical protein
MAEREERIAPLRENERKANPSQLCWSLVVSATQIG